MSFLLVGFQSADYEAYAEVGVYGEFVSAPKFD
jgi:hypothetical protein